MKKRLRRSDRIMNPPPGAVRYYIERKMAPIGPSARHNGGLIGVCVQCPPALTATEHNLALLLRLNKFKLGPHGWRWCANHASFAADNRRWELALLTNV